jgi:hemerythrin-like domain-containing protein
MGETATRVLRDEHLLILDVASALETTLGTEVAGGVPDLDVIADCIAFFRLFADRCHHAKEEDLLFRELEESGMPADSGPIAVMLAEHRHGRLLVAAMGAALEKIRAGRTDATHELSAAAWSYIDLIRAHIGKEDNILFEIADSLIDGGRCQRLCAGYADADGCAFGDRTKAQLETLATTITARTS